MVDIATVLEALSSNWALVLVATSGLALVLGWVRFGISPLQRLEEVAHRQATYRREAREHEFRERMRTRHVRLGNAFLDECQLGAAKAEFQSALDLDPTCVEAQFGLMKSNVFEPILNEAVDLDPIVAEKRLQLIFDEQPDDKHALLFMGNVYVGIDEHEALRCYRAVLDQDPTLAAAYTNMGFVFDRRGDPDSALQMYEQAGERSKWNGTVLNNLGYHYVRVGRYDEAIDKLELLIALDPPLLIACWNLATAYRLRGDFERSYSVHRRVMRLFADTAVTSLKRNRAPWHFEVGPSESVLFRDMATKELYTRYSTALAAMLTEREEEAHELVAKAAELECDDPTPALRFIEGALRRLAAERPDARPAVVRFHELLDSDPRVRRGRERRPSESHPASVAPAASLRP